MERTYQIIVGIDGSEAGQRALDWAVAEAARRARAGEPTSVQAITAYERVAGPMALGAGLPDPAAVAEQTVTAAVVAARRHGRDVPIAGEAVHGPAADVLGAACTTADLLVLGSHGHSRLHTAVLGSVSEACVRLATCPVLIIPAMRTVPAGSRAVAVPASG